MSLRLKLIDNVIHYLYYDNYYLRTPKVDWRVMNVLDPHFSKNYFKVRPTLLEWQEKGYITLIEDEDDIFQYHADKLPSAEVLRAESGIDGRGYKRRTR